MLISIAHAQAESGLGVGSDVLVKRFHMSRFWCVVVSAAVFSAAQAFAIETENPHSLGLVSGLSGLGYGFLFGVYPTLVAETFGVHGLSQNWGTMTLAPVISGNIFNLFYGAIYDHHSIVAPDGDRECLDGLECYRDAYWVTLVSSLAGVVLSLWCVYLERTKKLEERRHRLDGCHDREE